MLTFNELYVNGSASRKRHYKQYMSIHNNTVVGIPRRLSPHSVYREVVYTHVVYSSVCTSNEFIRLAYLLTNLNTSKTNTLTPTD